jgi:hypothetical protein
LVELVKYYIVQCGGYASSRDLGRFLATNQASNSKTNSALAELKNNFGGVASFLNQQSHIFTIVREPPTDGDPMNFSFGIKLKDFPVNMSNVSLNNSSASQVSIGNIPTHTLNNNSNNINIDPNVDAHIEELIREYLHASGGEASSRNIGRYLAANAAFPARKSGDAMNGTFHDSALKQLKHHYGSLAGYLSTKENVFDKVSNDFQSRQGGNDSPLDHSFVVRLK